jgi:hypothetical protein
MLCAPAAMRRVLSLLFFVVVAACSSSSSGGGDQAKPAAPPPAGPVNPGESPESQDKPKDPDTQMVVGLDSEDFSSQGFRIGTVDVVATIDGVVAAQETLDSSKGPMFPHELHVAPPAASPESTLSVTITAHDSGTHDDGAPPVVKRTATAKFVKGRAMLLFVFLEVRCNTDQLVGGGGPSGPTCTVPGETCIAGVCKSDLVANLPDYRADWAANPPSACGSGAPEITIGKGETSYAPLADGDTADVQEGPQCGHHIWLALGMKNLSQFKTITTLSATQPGTGVTVPATAFPYAYAANGADCELVGVRFQLDITNGKIGDFLGKPLDITVQGQDKAGNTTTAIRHVNVASSFTKGPRPCP